MINKEWHKKHKMPKNATPEQKLKWHLEHNKHCKCRPGIPKGLLAALKKKKK